MIYKIVFIMMNKKMKMIQLLKFNVMIKYYIKIIESILILLILLINIQQEFMLNLINYLLMKLLEEQY